MSPRMEPGLARDLADPAAVKALATVGRDGEPHVVFKECVSVNPDGDIEILEIIETSQSNRNLTHSLWFGRPLAINLLTADRRSHQIKGVAKRAIISGERFEQAYRRLREESGVTELAAIWVVEIREIRDQDLATRMREEKAAHPFVGHLDNYTRGPLPE